MDKTRNKNVFFAVVFLSGSFFFFLGSSTVIEYCKLQLYLKKKKSVMPWLVTQNTNTN